MYPHNSTVFNWNDKFMFLIVFPVASTLLHNLRCPDIFDRTFKVVQGDCSELFYKKPELEKAIHFPMIPILF
jgi:hypothetical protein